MHGGTEFKEIKKLEYIAVQKALSILLCLMADNKSMGTLQLSKSLNLNKSTVSRLLQVLVYYGLVRKDKETRKYELGRTSALLGMAIEASQTDRLAQFAQSHIDRLRDTIGESVCVEVISSGHCITICEAIGPPPISVTFPPSVPMHASSAGKIILAFSGSEVIHNLINAKFEQFTENTITDIEVFKDRLKEIRLVGIAYDHGEMNTEVHALSAPIFNHLKKPVAAISICVPANRIKKILKNRSIDELKNTAGLISEHLYYLETDIKS